MTCATLSASKLWFPDSPTRGLCSANIDVGLEATSQHPSRTNRNHHSHDDLRRSNGTVSRWRVTIAGDVGVVGSGQNEQRKPLFISAGFLR